MRNHDFTLVREGRERHRMLEHVDLGSSDRQRLRILQRRPEAHRARGLDDLGAAGFRVAVTEHDGKPHRNGVDRIRDRLRERDRARMRAAVILRAPIAQANRLVDNDGCRL